LEVRSAMPRPLQSSAVSTPRSSIIPCRVSQTHPTRHDNHGTTAYIISLSDHPLNALPAAEEWFRVQLYSQNMYRVSSPGFPEPVTHTYTTARTHAHMAHLNDR
jgi:hypothetical protein